MKILHFSPVRLDLPGYPVKFITTIYPKKLKTECRGGKRLKKYKIVHFMMQAVCTSHAHTGEDTILDWALDQGSTNFWPPRPNPVYHLFLLITFYQKAMFIWFTYCLSGSIPTIMAELSNCCRNYMACKSKTFTICPFEKVCNTCFRQWLKQHVEGISRDLQA